MERFLFQQRDPYLLPYWVEDVFVQYFIENYTIQYRFKADSLEWWDTLFSFGYDPIKSSDPCPFHNRHQKFQVHQISLENEPPLCWFTGDWLDIFQKLDDYVPEKPFRTYLDKEMVWVKPNHLFFGCLLNVDVGGEQTTQTMAFGCIEEDAYCSYYPNHTREGWDIYWLVDWIKEVFKKDEWGNPWTSYYMDWVKGYHRIPRSDIIEQMGYSFYRHEWREGSSQW